MKIKNVKKGDYVIMKTKAEMKKSKYYRGKTRGGGIVFASGASFYDCTDGEKCGKTVKVLDVNKYGTLSYENESGEMTLLSAHAFKKMK